MCQPPCLSLHHVKARLEFCLCRLGHGWLVVVDGGNSERVERVAGSCVCCARFSMPILGRWKATSTSKQRAGVHSSRAFRPGEWSGSAYAGSCRSLLEGVRRPQTNAHNFGKKVPHSQKSGNPRERKQFPSASPARNLHKICACMYACMWYFRINARRTRGCR